MPSGRGDVPRPGAPGPASGVFLAGRVVFEKLQTDYQRFREVEAALLDPAVVADVGRMTALAKERGALARIALPYGRYLELGRQIAEAEGMLAAEADPEMRAYAEAELEDLRSRRDVAAEALR